MKIFKAVLLCLIFLLIACDDSTSADESGSNNKVGSIYGNWAFVKVVYTEVSGGESSEEIMTPLYTSTYNNYYNIPLLSVLEDQTVVLMENHPGKGYYSDTSTISDDKMILDEQEYTYSLGNNELVLEARYDHSETEYEIEKWILERCEGHVPPESWTSGLPEDSYESDNTPSNATLLTPGADPQKHTITQHDTDWVSFNALEGNTYRIILQSNSNFESFSLYDTSGTTEMDYNDSTSSYSPFYIEKEVRFKCESSGTYYFMNRSVEYEGESGRTFSEGYYNISIKQEESVAKVLSRN